jgi:hypothetical protein
MAKVVRKHVYRPNRKKVFELDDLCLWLNTREEAHGALGVVLELMRRQPSTRSKWNVCWSGIVRIEGKTATVETTPKSKWPATQNFCTSQERAL